MKVLKTVTAPQRRSAGAPTPKDPNLTLIKTDDILAWPAISQGGVLLQGDFVLKPGAKMLQVYLTASKQSATGEGEGDEDAVGLLQKFEGSHPGTEQEISEFVLAALGVGFILISGNCRDKQRKKVYGTECSPMKLKPGYTENNEGTMFNILFEQYMRTDQVPYIYTGNMAFALPFEATDENLNLLVANGQSYQLPAFADELGTALDVAATDMEHGDIVTLIGGGGAEPATLSTGAATAATVLLKDGTDWTALQNATISLEVFKDGAATYLIERART